MLPALVGDGSIGMPVPARVVVARDPFPRTFTTVNGRKTVRLRVPSAHASTLSPARPVLHRVVRENLAAFLAEARERSEHGFGLPRFLGLEHLRRRALETLIETVRRTVRAEGVR